MIARLFLIHLGLLLLAAPYGSHAADRINQEGRLLGTTPAVTNAILFNTPAADAIVSTLQIFPRDNAWNEDITRRPVLTNSDAMIAQITADLSTNRRTLRAFQEMNFVLVPDSQPLVPIEFFYAPEESDPSPYPIPSNLPVETWPTGTGTLTLEEWQRDINGNGGDRHSIIVQPGTGYVWETWESQLTANPTNWQAANGAQWNLNSNALRPLFWTSADAAGLSMFGGLARYDECERGMVEHAIRLVVAQTRREFIYPATHRASSSTNPNRPAMGQRLRLTAGFTIPGNWTTHEKAIARALKKYGGIVADNGNFLSISVVPDQRWPGYEFTNLTSISVTNFEVIQSTGPNEGPRSPGAPAANAGPDQAVNLGAATTLEGSVLYTNAAPLTIQWRLYSGPGAATFGNPSQTNTTATFGAPGIYTLMLSADDGVHTVGYDAVVITVQVPIQMSIVRNGTNVVLQWIGGTPPYQLEQAPSLPATQWNPVLTTNGTSVTVRVNAETAYFRVRSPNP